MERSRTSIDIPVASCSSSLDSISVPPFTAHSHSNIILENSPENISLCASYIANGGLVAFPGDTVYGLGTDAYNRTSVLRIFDLKQRPLNDPMILFVSSFDEQIKQKLLAEDLSETFLRFLGFLAERFCPGPLAFVVPCRAEVPTFVTAGTGFVGIRVPGNETARELIRQSGKFVVAPSANLFGHVSPTHWKHVQKDLGHSESIPIVILKDSVEYCSVGFEATILRIEEEETTGKIVVFVLRKGSTPTAMVRQFVERIAQEHDDISLVLRVESDAVQHTVNESLYGERISHYSTSIPTYFVSSMKEQKMMCEDENEGVQEVDLFVPLSETILIDFGGSFASLEHECLQYFDLSQSGDSAEAGRNLYRTLREAEDIGSETAKCLVLPNLRNHEEENALSELLNDSIQDRIFRSAGGRSCVVSRLGVHVENEKT